LAASICVLAFLVGSASADVFRVQEDWELVLDEVSECKHAPQFETLMCPFSELGGSFARVTWNYQELPAYVPGGFQMQTWGGDILFLRRDREGEVFSTAGETVAWTQELEIDGSDLYFRVHRGQSTTWGSFGGQDARLRLALAPENLNGYRSTISVDGSGITYGANRVLVLRIKEIRYYNEQGELLAVDPTSRIVHQRQ
jgi:hypothetical protein